MSIPTAILVGVVSVTISGTISYLYIARSLLPLEDLTAQLLDACTKDQFEIVNISDGGDFSDLSSAIHKLQLHVARHIHRAEVDGQRLATVLGGMTEGVMAVDRDERILFANDACLRLLEIGARELRGRPLLETTRSRALQEAISKSFDQPTTHDIECPAPGIGRRFLALRMTQLPGDPCPGVVAVLQDVTELRRLENLRRDFAANVSHELKSPLSSIKAYAETLRLGAVNDEAHNLLFLGRIEEEADRLHQLILDLLQISRMESGREIFEITTVNLQELLSECVDNHQQAARSKRIALELDQSTDLHVRADYEGLTTVFDNLVRNAINYTPEGGRILLRWSRSRGCASIEVEDTGIGIAPIHHDRIFERFYRVDRARSRELGGTGLGLSIVKHLVNAFGGTVGLRSELGTGCTFFVKIPLDSP